MPDWKAYEEAYNRGILPEDKKGLYEEAVRRGLTSGEVIETKMPPAEGTITKAPPPWMKWAKGGLELGGLVFGQAPGYAAGKLIGKYGSEALGYTEPVRPGAAEERQRTQHDYYLGMAQELLGERATPELTSKMEQEYQKGQKISEAMKIPSEVGGALGEGMLMGVGGEIGGKIGGRAFRWAVNKLPGATKATTPEMQGVIELAKRENVSVLAPDITGNRTQALLFNAADKAIGGSGVTQKASARVVMDMDAYGNRMLEQLGGRFDPTVMGQVAREGMQVRFDPVQKFGSQLYDNFVNEAAGLQVNLPNTINIIQEIRTSKDFLYLPGQIKSVLNKVFSDLSPVVKKMPNVRYGGLPEDILTKLQEQGISKTMSVDELESIRRALSKLSFNKEISGDVGNRIAVRVLEGIDKDMTVSAQGAGSLAKEALEDARKFQAEQIFGVFKGTTKLGKPSIGTRIQQVQNEDFLKIISKGNLTELQDMKKVLPNETMQTVKRAWLTDIFSKYQRELQTPRGRELILNSPRIATELDKYGDKYLGTLFNDQEFKMVKDFIKLGRHIGFAEKIAGNPSGTAQTIYTIQLITGAGLAGYGTWKRDPIAAGTGIVFTFGGPYAIAKFMTSPAGFKYMTSGIKVSPVINEIISNSIKTAAVIGTHASMDINQRETGVQRQE